LDKLFLIGYPRFFATQSAAMLRAQILMCVVGVVQADGECCKTCVTPEVKYYSVDMKHGHCGENCLNPNQFGLFKIFEPNLTLSNGSTAAGFTGCAELGWPKYRETVTHGFWPIKATVDLYDRDEQAHVSAVSSCSLIDVSKGGVCAQSDLDCRYTGPAKAFRSTLQEGTCASQGFTVKTGESSFNVPVIGTITATTYSKGAILVM